MRLDGLEESTEVEDRRRAPTGKIAAGGGLATLVIALLVMALGGDPKQVLESGALQGTQGQQSRTSDAPMTAEEAAGKEFVAKVLRQTEEVWTQVFEERGQRYRKPKLVLFSDRVQSGCGPADSGVGPFYCPGDSKVYIDLSFYQLMEDRLGGGGDFAQAYVIAHEVGHHIQNLTGVSMKVDQARRRLSEKEFNSLSVRQELQADFYAGIFAHHAQGLRLDRKDIQEALNTASAIGDDALQKQSGSSVHPDSFTHGSSEQRVRWFLKGYESGRMEDGNTFSAKRL